MLYYNTTLNVFAFLLCYFGELLIRNAYEDDSHCWQGKVEWLCENKWWGKVALDDDIIKGWNLIVLRITGLNDYFLQK